MSAKTELIKLKTDVKMNIRKKPIRIEIWI